MILEKNTYFRKKIIWSIYRDPGIRPSEAKMVSFPKNYYKIIIFDEKWRFLTKI